MPLTDTENSEVPLKHSAPNERGFISRTSSQSKLPPEDDSDLHEGDSPPLQEAEVFLAFGLAESAEAVLISALKDGTLTQDEVDRFWARPALDRASGD